MKKISTMMMAYFSTFLLLALAILGVMNLGITFTYEASAEGVGDVYIDTDYDHVRGLNREPEWYDNFCNSTDINSTGWADTSGAWKSLGYMYLNASSATSEYANRAVTELSAATTGMFEFMYYADSKQAQDVVQMNLTLNSTYHAYDFDNFAVGNEYNVARIWYKNATQNQTVDLDAQTFEADTWYIFQIYFNANYTQDVEWRWKENFTIVDSKHISDANLSSIGNVSLMNLSNDNGGGGSANAYTFEYVWYDSTIDVGEGTTDESTGYAPVNPDDEKHVWKIRASEDIDIDDMDIDYRNMSGGNNNSALLNRGDFWDNGAEGAPANIDALIMADEDSYYSGSDLKHIAGMTPEKNETTQHREAQAFGFGANTETYLLDNVREQFFNDKDEGFVVSYRVYRAWIHFEFSEDLTKAVNKQWDKSMKASDADRSDFTDGYTGTGAEIEEGVSDSLDDVHKNVFGALVVAYKEPDDLIDDEGILSSTAMDASVASWFDGMAGSFRGAASFTNAGIGSIIGGGKELLFDGGELIITTFGTLVMLPFTLLFGGTLGKIITIIVILAVGVLVIALVEHKTGAVSRFFKKTAKRGRKI